MATMVAGDVKDLALSSVGYQRILWAERDMPVLRAIRERFEVEKPLEGLRMSACLHVTAETANLARTLVAGGADLVLVASNPLSTQDDVAASLVNDFNIPVYAIKGEDESSYYRHIAAALKHQPHVTMDDGADLVSAMIFIALDRLKDVHEEVRGWAEGLGAAERAGLVGNVVASMEETTTGVIRLRAMEKDGVLKLPGHRRQRRDDQALLRQPLRDRPEHHRRRHPRHRHADRRQAGGRRRLRLVRQGRRHAGQGHGRARDRDRGRPDPRPRSGDGRLRGAWTWARPRRSATCSSPSPATSTSSAAEHFAAMKDGAMVCNSGHFNVELALDQLAEAASTCNKGVREFVDEYVLADGRRIYILGEGRLINLAAAHGHPASVMDMSFAAQALATEWSLKMKGKLDHRVYNVPKEVDQWVSTLKLQSMGITIDTLTPEQAKYLESWEMGT